MGPNDLCCLTFAGFIGLSLALLHIIVPILILTTCSGQVLTVVNLIYVTYFYNEKKCGFQHLEDIFPDKYNITHLAGYIRFPEVAKWEKVFSVVMLIYVALDGTWIIISSILLYVALTRKRGKLAATIYFAWAINGTLLLAQDLAGGLLFTIHLFQINGLEDWLDVVGATYTNFTYTNNENLIQAMRAPSFNCMFFFTRYFVFWVVNLIAVVRVFQAAVRITHKVEAIAT